MENSDQTPSNCPETLAMLAYRYSSLGASDLGYQIDANDVSNELVLYRTISVVFQYRCRAHISVVPARGRQNGWQ